MKKILRGKRDISRTLDTQALWLRQSKAKKSWRRAGLLPSFETPLAMGISRDRLARQGTLATKMDPFLLALLHCQSRNRKIPW